MTGEGKAEPIETARELILALSEATDAKARFAALPPSHQREYADWVGSAKRGETRRRRAAQAVERLSRNETRAAP